MSLTKKLKTTELLDKLKDADDKEWGQIFDELIKREPLDYLNGKIEELEGLVEKQEGEIKKLRNSVREHNHLPNGKAVKGI